MLGKRKQYKTLRYIYFESPQSTTVIVIFPGAAVGLSGHKNIIRAIYPYASVLFIQSGYFGITPIHSLKEKESFSHQLFGLHLSDLLERYKDKKLVFLASSVGAIHALAYANRYPKRVRWLVLAAPAFAKTNRFIHLLYKVSLTLTLRIQPNRVFLLLIRSLGRFPRYKSVAKVMRSVTESIGVLSYLLCLSEIATYSRYNREIISYLLRKKTVVFIGNQDQIFHLLCDQNLCSKAKALYTVSCGHNIVKTGYQPISEELQRVIRIKARDTFPLNSW